MEIIPKTIWHLELDDNDMKKLRFLVDAGKAHASKSVDNQNEWLGIAELADKILGEHH